MREVVAEFERPVMLYSIGKDSSVLLRLAQKAFYPGPIPFPLLHIDTTYKFREMIDVPRPVCRGDRRAADRAHQPARRSPTARSRSPSARSAAAALLKTKSLLDALEAGGFDAAFGGARRDEEKIARQGARLLAARRPGPVGSEAPAPRALAPAQQPHRPGREHPRLPAVELDRARRLALHPRREHPGRAALLRARARGHRPRQLADRPASSRSCRCCRASGRRW